MQSAGQQVAIGVLFSTTGPYASLGREGFRGAMAAIAEINAAGRHPFTLAAAIRDPHGNTEAYASLCRDIIDSSGAQFVVGCTTSWSRKEVIPVLEKTGTHLWYPCPYEGFEGNDHVVYVGACPNQHIVPLLGYVLERFGHDPMLVGSNYIWGWETNRIARECVERRGGSVKAERFLPLGDTDVAHLIDEVRRKRPDFILNTLIGPSSQAFIAAYWQVAQEDPAFAAELRPIISCNWTENEVAELGDQAAGHLSVAPYFQSIESEANTNFLAVARKFAPEQRYVSAFFVQAYVAVHMIAGGIAAAGRVDADAALAHAKTTSFAAPFGSLRIEANTNHAILTPQIGRARADGSFEVVSRAAAPIVPDPYLAHAGKPAAGRRVAHLQVVK